MTRRRAITLGSVAVLAAVGLGIAAAILSLGPDTPPHAQSALFSPIPAVGNIAALGTENPAVEPVPERVVRLGGGPSVRRLSANGYVWTKGRRSVCVLMASGSAGCFTTFTRPFVLFMSGSTSRSGETLTARVEGVVPDAVTAVEIVMADGPRVPVEISGNSFQTDLPEGVEIVAAEVSLSDGATLFEEEPLSPHAPGG